MKNMKTKLILAGLLVAGLVGAIWFAAQRVPVNSVATAAGRKILYYQSAMHPWIKSDKPGKCPICGMNLVPIYEGESSIDTNMTPGMVKLNADSVSVINVQTGTVERRPLRRTLHLAGQIIRKSATASWFEFTAYERDLPWLQIDQIIEVQMPSAPGIIYSAQIKLHGTQPFADADFDMMTGSTKVRAEILDATPEAAGLGAHKIFNGLHADGHLVAKTPEVLTVPRSAVLSRGIGPLVYVDKGNGHYAPRAVLLGRAGDEFYEVLAGLEAGEKVVTNGNLLIDSEAQLAAGQ
jgi:hypothetical protein